MPVLDFTEIPRADVGPNRDAFELFARDFLQCQHFKVLIGPDRGADAGRDLVTEEIRTGIVGETRVKWLVSCKHNAHSTASVSHSDEPSITDRVRAHGCSGFIGFYSTLPSNGLAAVLNSPTIGIETTVYDSAKIEQCLLASQEGQDLARRYFPLSYGAWALGHRGPVEVFSSAPTLQCHHCGKELLKDGQLGIVVIWRRMAESQTRKSHNVSSVYWCCKGACDDALKPPFRAQGLIDGWEDIEDLKLPAVYIKWVMSMLNNLHGGADYSAAAFDRLKDPLLNLYPFIARNISAEEREHVEHLRMIPSYLGGLGSSH